MLKLIAAEQAEFDRGIMLMRLNMSAALEKNGIPWDDDWNREHYGSLDNYSVLLRDHWIGFVSIELMLDALFVHTVQLAPGYQGNLYGMKIFQWLRSRALENNKKLIRCRAIEGSQVIEQYSRLGFAFEGVNGVLVSLVLSLGDSLSDMR